MCHGKLAIITIKSCAVDSRESGTIPHMKPVGTAWGLTSAAGILVLCAVLPSSYASAQCLNTMITDFEGYADNDEVVLQNPRFSQSTSTNLTTTPDTRGVTGEVTPDAGSKCYKLAWQFVDGGTSRWLRATSFDADNVPNPTIELNKPIRIRFRIDSPSSGSLRVSLGVRETGTSAAVGQNGGTSGTIEWIGATGTISGSPQGKLLAAFPGVWQTLVFAAGADPVLAFTGNGVLSSATGKGTLEHLAFACTGNAGPFTVYIDTLSQLCELPPSITGDFDRDTDVDLDDFTFFEACLTGPAAGAIHPACVATDFDHDMDSDQTDFGIFQRCLSGPDIPADPDCSGLSPIPPRPANAITGSQFVTQVWSLPKATREQMILSEMSSGNIPEFLRNFVPVTVTATINTVQHTGTYDVMPDYLAIGSDADFVRMPMGPLTAQPIADAFGCLLPTRKMVNQIYTAASVKLAPHPYSPNDYNIESVDVFNQSNSYIEGQRLAAGAPLGALIGGTKKDVVITPLLATNPNKVAIYGWHQLNGQPIQPLYLGHDINYMDYSHGIRFIKRSMIVDGANMLVADVLNNANLAALLSDEGTVANPRY